jgi:hypothetical protein
LVGVVSNTGKYAYRTLAVKVGEWWDI